MNRKSCMTNVFLFAILFYSLLILSCKVGDDDPPADLDNPSQGQGIEYNSLTRSVEFITPGDDGFSGTATVFDLRYFDEFQIEELSSSSIDDLSMQQIEQIMQENFDDAVQIQGEIEPGPGGSEQSVVFTRVEPLGEIKYFLSLNIRDEVGNNSGPSNVVEASTALITTVFEDTSQQSCFGASVSSGNLIEEDKDDEDLERLSEANDIIIGDPCLDRAYVFQGNKSLGGRDFNSDGTYELPAPDTADIVIIGDPGTMFGAKVAALRDIKGGSLDEIVISAPGADSNRGSIIVIFDEKNETYPPVMDLNAGFVPDILINGEQPGDNFGIEMITARGVISSSNDNIIASAPSALSNRGRVYLFKENILANNSLISASEAIIFSGESPGDEFGTGISLAGIINNDSRIDIAVSSPPVAKVYIIFGDNNLDDIDLSVDTSEVAIISGNVADEFAVSVSGNGDLDGDPEEISRSINRDDVIIGAPGFNMNTGKVFVYSGFDIEDSFKDGTEVPSSHEINGILSGGRFGQELTFLGDINPEVEIKNRAEGTVLFLDEPTDDDIAISAPGVNNGSVYLFFGNMNLPFNLSANNAGITIDGMEGSAGFGNVLENLDDINSDDINDFAIGEDNRVNVIF